MGYPDPPGYYMIQDILFKKSPWMHRIDATLPLQWNRLSKAFLCLISRLRRSSSHSIRYCANSREGYKNIFVQVLMQKRYRHLAAGLGKSYARVSLALKYAELTSG